MTRLAINQLLQQGSLSGPYRRTHPLKLSLWARIVRALRARRIPRGPDLERNR